MVYLQGTQPVPAGLGAAPGHAVLFQKPRLVGGKPPDLAQLGPHYLLTETYFLGGTSDTLQGFVDRCYCVVPGFLTIGARPGLV